MIPSVKNLVTRRGRTVAQLGRGWLALIGLCGACLPAVAGGQRYSILTTQQMGIDSDGNTPVLNNRGQIAARSKSGHVLFYDGQKTIDYGVYSGMSFTYVHALNDNGEIAGYAYDNSTAQRFILRNGTFEPIGAPVPTAYYNGIRGFNNAGHVIYSVMWPNGNMADGVAGILYHDGVETILGNLGAAFTWPMAINRSDQITGDSFVPPNADIHAFLWQDGKMVDLNGPVGSYSAGQAINDAGVIAGYLDLATQRRRTLFLYSVGQFVDLGKVGNFADDIYDGSYVEGMNNLGVIVGWAGRDFIWMGGQIMHQNDWFDRAGMGIYAVSAMAVNDRGQLLAAVHFDDSPVSATICLLTPLPPTGEAAHLVNISARAGAGAGDQTCITGFVVRGGSRSILVRTVGPTLQPQGVTGFAADPALKLYDGGTLGDTNDNWGAAANAAAIATTMSTVGAFDLPAASKDAALLVNATEGVHSVHASDPSGTAGVVLSEIYDAGTGGSGRLVNCSARVQVGTGDALGILGFVIQGEGPATVLLRAVGPSLKGQGVDAVLADPVLWLHNPTQKVMGNDNWGSAVNQPLLAETMAKVGAFALPDGSKDAALLVQLMPGAYSMTVTGADGGTGVALLEVYLVPPAQ